MSDEWGGSHRRSFEARGSSRGRGVVIEGTVGVRSMSWTVGRTPKASHPTIARPCRTSVGCNAFGVRPT